MEIRQLNSIRAIAAFIVVISHYSNATGIFGKTLGAGAGQFGVMLFFILSGFLMSWMYLDREYGKSSRNHFLVARLARVVPLFVFVVLISYFSKEFGVAKGIFYALNGNKDLVTHLLFLYGTGVLWTIPPEIQFYLLFLLLWQLHDIKPKRLYLLIGVIVLALLMTHLPAETRKIRGYPVQANLIIAFPFFAVGMLFGQLYKKWKVPDKLRSHLFLLAFLAIPLLYPKIFRSVFGFDHGMWRDLSVLLTMSAVFFALVFLVPAENKILSNRLGDFLGKISYSLYLLHMPVLHLLNDSAKESPFLFLPIFVFGVTAVSAVFYYLLESPSRNAIRSAFQLKWLATNQGTVG
jgi:peptidoglycan/LPS O-acetylase OafA/YrhL